MSDLLPPAPCQRATPVQEGLLLQLLHLGGRHTAVPRGSRLWQGNGSCTYMRECAVLCAGSLALTKRTHWRGMLSSFRCFSISSSTRASRSLDSRPERAEPSSMMTLTFCRSGREKPLEEAIYSRSMPQDAQLQAGVGPHRP